MGFMRTFKFALVGVLVSLFVHWIINWTNGVDINGEKSTQIILKRHIYKTICSLADNEGCTMHI